MIVFYLPCSRRDQQREAFHPFNAFPLFKEDKSCPLIPNKHLSFSVWNIINPACVRSESLRTDVSASMDQTSGSALLGLSATTHLLLLDAYRLMYGWISLSMARMCKCILFNWFVFLWLLPFFCKVCVFSIFVLTVIKNGCK